MGKRTTIEQRELVLHHYRNGISRRKIAEIVDIPDGTVKAIIHRFVFENRVENKGRNAPNKIFSASDERYIVQKVKQNPKLSAPKLASEMENMVGKSCSAETIRRILRNNDLHGRVARKKPFINKKKSRLPFEIRKGAH